MLGRSHRLANPGRIIAPAAIAVPRQAPVYAERNARQNISYGAENYEETRPRNNPKTRSSRLIQGIQPRSGDML